MPKAKAKKSNYIFLFLRIAFVTAGIIGAIVWGSQEQRWRKLTEINALIFIATLGIFVVSQIIVGFRWWILLRAQSVFIGFWAAVRLHFLGLFYNNCMPGSVGGDMVRAWYVTKHTNRKFEAALSVFVDRVVGLLSTLVIAAFFYMLFLQGQSDIITTEKKSGFLQSAGEYKGILLGFFVALIIVLLGFVLYRPTRMILAKAWSFICAHSLRAIGKFKDSAILYCSKPLTILAVFGLTFFLQIMVITGFWFLGRSLGITASIKYYYVFFTLTWVLGTIPISIGGAVVVEGMLMVLFINIANVAEGSAYALALCQRAVWILASLPGAAIHLLGAHLPKNFFVDYNKFID
jgi:uncharacterized protein (TIRG00374 family)